MQYDLVIMATFPELASLLGSQSQLLLQRRPGQRILLTVHNPRWLLETAGPLAPLMLLAQQAAPAPRGGPRPVQPVQLLGLSPCSAAYTTSLLGSWAAHLRHWMPGWAPQLGPGAAPDIPWIVPLVPWAPANETGGAAEAGASLSLASRKQSEYRGPLANLCIQVGGPAAAALAVV